MDNQQKHTPAPWRWELNKKCHQVQLCGGIPKFDKIVMDFCRYGMGKGAPRFNDEVRTDWNVMERADHYAQIVEGREHHADWFQTISHPDAQLICAAPELLEICIVLKNTLSPLVNNPVHEDVMKSLEQAIHKALTVPARKVD